MIKCNDEILNKFVESVGTKYNFNDKQKEVLQNEVSVTITQLLDSNKLTDIPAEGNIDNNSGIYIVSTPINDLYDLSQSLINSPVGNLKLYIRYPSFVNVKANHQDMEGDVFTDTVSIPADKYIFIGTISRTNKIWSFKIDHGLPNEYFDLSMYVRCWNCAKNNHIRDFINDIYYRINRTDKYSAIDTDQLNIDTSNKVLTPVITNESVNIDDKEDEVQYSMEFNPDNVLVYLNNNFNEMLNEDDSNEDKIKTFLEAVFDTDKCEITKITESVSKAILTVLGTFALGKATNTLLKSAGIGNITRNPNSDTYKASIDNTGTGRRVKSLVTK